MISKQQEFLEMLKDPLRHGVQKACFDFHNSHPKYKDIYDLRILQVNELPYYHVILETRHFHQQTGMVNDFVDMLDEYTPANTIVVYHAVQETSSGTFTRTYYVFEDSITSKPLVQHYTKINR